MGYPLKAIALALSEKEDLGGHIFRGLNGTHLPKIERSCPSNFRIGLVAAPGAADSMRVETQPFQLESALPVPAPSPWRLVGGG